MSDLFVNKRSIMYKKARRIYSDKRRGAYLRAAFIFKKVGRVFLFDFIIRSKYFSVSDWLK